MTTKATNSGRVTIPAEKLPSTDGYFGFRFDDDVFLFSSDELSDAQIDAIWEATGRTEVQIVMDIAASPGRHSIARFLCAATIFAGRPISLEAARMFARSKTATVERLYGDDLARAILKIEANRPNE
jgi:hypothetical protein